MSCRYRKEVSGGFDSRSPAGPRRKAAWEWVQTFAAGHMACPVVPLDIWLRYNCCTEEWTDSWQEDRASSTNGTKDSPLSPQCPPLPRPQ